MAARTIRRIATILFGATGVLLSVVALFLLSVTAQNSDDFGRLSDAILIINIVASPCCSCSSSATSSGCCRITATAFPGFA